MRIVVASDRFAGMLSAPQVTAAIATGWRRWQPEDELVGVPLSDGGDGFAYVLEGGAAASLAGGTAAGRTVVVDAADDGDTTALGAAVLAALRPSVPAVTRVVVGLAGGIGRASDGGLGALLALGGVQTGRHLDLTDVRRRLADVDLVIATDVDDPADSVPDWLPTTAASLAASPGAGARRGTGLALLAVGATRINASQYAIDVTGLAGHIAGPPVADLVVTGEATLGPNSKRGRVVAGVARTAAASGSPVIAFCDSLEFGRRELANLGLEAAYACGPHGVMASEQQMLDTLADRAERVARTWSPRW